MNIEIEKAVAQLGLVVLRWHGETATVECPGGAHHKDAILYTKPFLHVHCFHTSCETTRKEFNNSLRDINDRISEKCFQEPTPERTRHLKEVTAWKKHLKKIEALARDRLLPNLRERDELYWQSTSPFNVAAVPVKQHFRLFFSGLYPEDAILWCGEIHESASPKNDLDCRLNFRTAKEWCERLYPYGQQTSLVSFYRSCRETGERRREHIRFRHFNVIEFDHTPKPKAGGILEWSMKYRRLRAIVDTGGKSWHGVIEVNWPPRYRITDCPIENSYTTNAEEKAAWDAFFRIRDSEKKEEHALHLAWQQRSCEFEAMCIGMGADKMMLTSSLTMRLPGSKRLDKEGNSSGKYQRLIWLDPLFAVKL